MPPTRGTGQAGPGGGAAASVGREPLAAGPHTSRRETARVPRRSAGDRPAGDGRGGSSLGFSGVPAARPRSTGGASTDGATATTRSPSGSTVTFQHRQPVRDRRRRFRRVLSRALIVSALLHGVLLLAWRGGPPPPPGAGEAGAGASMASASPPPPEGALRAVEVARSAAGEEGEPAAARMPESAPEVRSPAEPAAERLALETVRASAAPGAALDVAGGEDGSGEDGSPEAGGSGAPGEPGRISPPVPRSILPQWDPPGEVRGARVTVRVEVGRDGRPTGRVQLDPPTESEEFNRRLRETLTSLRYRPARRAGEPVEAWAEITFVF